VSRGKLLVFAAIVLLAVGAWMILGAAGDEAENRPAATVEKEPEGPSEEEVRKAAVRRASAAQLARLILGASPQERAKVMAILRNLGPEAIEFAREVFANPDDERAYAGAYVLSILGNADDKQLIKGEFLEEARDPPALLAHAAANLRNSMLVSEFEVLTRSADPTVREAAAVGLRAATTPDMTHIMVLLADAEPNVRAVAERSVTEMLPNANPGSLRSAVKVVLSSGAPADRVGALRLAKRIDAPWVFDMAGKATTDKDLRVRNAAVETLARTGDTRAGPALARVVLDNDSRGERVRAASAMGKVDIGKKERDALAAAAKGKDPVVALAAARSLVARRDARGIPALIELRHVKKSAALGVDGEDADLLAGLSRDVLKHASKGSRRGGETYEKWWARVGGSYRVPSSPFLPEFPKNH
jgi:HEAT repeat protein